MSAGKKRPIDLSHWHDPRSGARAEAHWESVIERGQEVFGRLSDAQFLEIARMFFAIVIDVAPFLTECRRRFGGLEPVLLALGFDRRNKRVPGYMRAVYETLHRHSGGLAIGELVARARKIAGEKLAAEPIAHWMERLPQFFEHRGRWFVSDYFPLHFADYATFEARSVLRVLIRKALDHHEREATIGTLMATLFPSLPPTAGGALREALRQVSRELGFTNQHDRHPGHAHHDRERPAEEHRHLAQDLHSLARHFAAALARTSVEVRSRKGKKAA